MQKESNGTNLTPEKRNTPQNTPCGLLVMDKPQGFTSFDLCAKLRGILHQKHIGHTGTLDPMATGVMVVLLGNAARASELLPDHDKRYTAGFRLGVTTDTLDSTGEVTREYDIDEYDTARAAVENALGGFRGDIMQLPPMYSAVHVDGERLYKLARKGVEVERTPRPVTISRLELLEYDEHSHEGLLDIECSKGTYIRALIDDIGTALGCGGIMTSLRRTRASGFGEGDAHTIEEVAAAAAEDSVARLLLPVDQALDIRSCRVSDKQAQRYRNGGGLSLARLPQLKNAAEGELVRVYCADGFIGVGRVATAKEPADEECPLELAPYKRLS